MLNSYLIVNYLAYLIKNNYAFSYTTSTSKLFSDGKIDLSTLSIGNIRATRLQKQCRKCKHSVCKLRQVGSSYAADLTALAPHLTASARKLTATLTVTGAHLGVGL